MTIVALTIVIWLINFHFAKKFSSLQRKQMTMMMIVLGNKNSLNKFKSIYLISPLKLIYRFKAT